MRRPVLGILGGVGPMATAYFMELIVRRTPAARDQDHLPMVVVNDPQIPDRTAYILDRTQPDPLPEMVAAARRLEAAGADYLAIPCNTAHYFHESIAEAVGVPVLNIMAETAAAVCGLVGPGGGVGLMATEGTVASGVFQDALGRAGLATVTPADADQRLLGRLIYDGVKAGRPYDPDELAGVAERLRGRGCEVVIVGCTELSVIAGALRGRQAWLVDSLEVLAERCVAWHLRERGAQGGGGAR